MIEIFGKQGEFIEADKECCDKCDLIEICDIISKYPEDIPFICDNGNPFSHKYFKENEVYTSN